MCGNLTYDLLLRDVLRDLHNVWKLGGPHRRRLNWLSEYDVDYANGRRGRSVYRRVNHVSSEVLNPFLAFVLQDAKAFEIGVRLSLWYLRRELY